VVKGKYTRVVEREGITRRVLSGFPLKRERMRRVLSVSLRERE